MYFMSLWYYTLVVTKELHYGGFRLCASVIVCQSLNQSIHSESYTHFVFSYPLDRTLDDFMSACV